MTRDVPPFLPIPPLEQSMARYRETVGALQTPDQHRATAQAVEDFLAGDGPAAQAELEARAAEAAQEGLSWLTKPWTASYLGTRAPLPITSNPAIEVVWPTPEGDAEIGHGEAGTAKAADLVARVAAVHLAWLTEGFEPEYDARGSALSMEQWNYLDGTKRWPGVERDTLEPGSRDTAGREILVLVGNRAWWVPVSDEAGRPLPAGAVQTALDAVLAGAAGQVVPGEEGELPFSAVTYLPGQQAATMLGQWRSADDNAALLDRIAAALFVLSLTDRHADEVTQLREVNFAPGWAWAWAPMTYHLNVADGFTAVHVEHTQLDAGILDSVLTRAKALPVTLDEAGASAPGQEVAPPEEATPPEEAVWHHTEADRAGLAEALDAYRRQAEDLHVEIVRAPTPTLAELPFKVSMDGMVQLSLAYAQARAFGQVRSTYESVDMREYAGGRTECLRPNTPAAVALAQAMVEGTATRDHLEAAMEGHRAAIKAAKGAQAIDRHLLGLQLAAEAAGLSAPIFADPGYAQLTEEFLSTSSMGPPVNIVRYTFAPIVPDGLGISYTPHPDQMEFTITYHADQREAVARFAAALSEGYRHLWDLLGA